MRFFIRAVVVLGICLPLGGCVDVLVFFACLLSGGDGCDELLYGGFGPKIQLSKGLVDGDARILANLTSRPCGDLGGGSYRCELGGINGGLVSTFTIDGGETSDKQALIVQMPLAASDFDGRWHTGDFDFHNLEISDGLLQVPVDKDSSLIAEPGHQLLVIDGEFAEIPFGGTTLWMDFAPNQSGPLTIKVLQAAIVKIGDQRFYPPIFPCVRDMGGAVELTLPASDNAEIEPPPVIPKACDGEVFMYFQNSKDFRVQGCMSGSWSDSDFNGQGFLIEILDSGLVLVYWFTFDDDGAPVWMFGVGQVEGTRITVTMLYETDGPFFGPGWNVDDFMPFEWGTLVLEFSGYNRGSASFDSLFPGTFPSHPMEIRRITNLWGPPCQPSDLELVMN